jgi:hypothetical protein
MSSDASETPEPANGSLVVVATGEQAARSRKFHEPAERDPLAADCGQLRHDGQRLPRELAEDRRLTPSGRCFDGER